MVYFDLEVTTRLTSIGAAADDFLVVMESDLSEKLFPLHEKALNADMIFLYATFSDVGNPSDEFPYANADDKVVVGDSRDTNEFGDDALNSLSILAVFYL